MKKSDSFTELQNMYDACEIYDEKEKVVDIAERTLSDSERILFQKFTRARRECEEFEY